MRNPNLPYTPRRSSAAALLLVSFLLAAAPAAEGQLVTSIFDGATPPEVQAGAPAGSFALSDFESVNLYSGKVNFALPLLRIGGRGEAGYTMTLRIERSWGFDTQFVCGTTNCAPEAPRHSALPMETTVSYDPGYSPGVLTMRTGINTVAGIVDDSNQTSSNCHENDVMEERKLTRLTFLRPDGAEVSLRDAKYGGEPFVNQNAAECRQEPSPGFSDRGREFVAADGSATVFVADEVVDEDITFTEYHSELISTDPQRGPAGRLAMRNGTIYRLAGGTDSGRVSWIRDRNGNQVSFLYGGPGGTVSQVTDPLGRVVNIAYDQNCAGTTCDKITYTGADNNSRAIEVHRKSLADLLCSRSGSDVPAIDRHLCPGAGAGNVKSHDQLFPKAEKGGDQGSNDGRIFNPDDLVSKVELPNGKYYSFKYTIYGELYSVTLPTDAVIEYDWRPAVTSSNCSLTAAPFCAGIQQTGNSLSLLRRVAERREKAAGSTVTARTTFALSTRLNCITGTSVACSDVTVKHYDSATARTPLSQEIHHFYGLANNPAQPAPWEYPTWRTGKEFQTEVKDSGGTLLRRIDNVWEQREQPAWWTSPTAPNPSSAGNGHNAANAPPVDVRIANTDTALPLTSTLNIVSRVAYSYSNDRFNNRTDVKQYDYDHTDSQGVPLLSSSDLLSWLHTEYETSSTYTLSGANFDEAAGVDEDNDGTAGAALKSYLPSVVTKQWLCGERASSCPESSAYAKNEFSIDHNSLVARSSISGHDSSNFSTSYTVRGNRTQLRRWKNPGNTEISQTLTYDIAGNVTKVLDFENIPTTISYADCFTSGSPPSGSGSTFAFPTTITRDAGGLDHEIRFCYDYDLGSQTEAYDENDFKTEFFYTDLLDRPTRIIDPLFATTTFTYDDDDLIITTTQQQDSCGSTTDEIVSKVVFDGFGRQLRSEQHEDGTACIATIQTYDGLGRVDEVGNPQRESRCLTPSDSMFLSLPADTTEYEYDGLGRVTRIIHPDGSSDRNQYISHITLHTDPAGNPRELTYDALERITRVNEGSSSDRYTTRYDYDALGNLTRVRQGPSSQQQQRTFGYDSLGRLVCAANPESRVGSAACNTSTLPTSGVDRFTYDNNSNLLTTTDARGVTVTTSYDHLNRPTSISYSDSTPDVNFCYDGADFVGSACTTSQVNGEKGQLTYAGSSVSATRYESFNRRGQVIGSSQQTGGATYSFSYSYNKAGALETQQYPSSLLVKTCYDAAGRIDEVSSTGTPAATYGSGFSYAPHGAIEELKLGNNLYEYRDYNNRLQPIEVGLGTFSGGSDKLKLEFTYGSSRNNNGNILSQVITRPSLSALTQSYTYNSLNRLISAAESGAGTAWSRSYSYDIFGNRAVSANRGLPTSPLMPTATTGFSSATNRLTLSGASYDNAGNLTGTPLGDTLAYDAENRLTGYTLSSATTNYKYGPQGRRVQKLTPTTTETYVYDAFGKLAAEYSTATPTSPGTFYRTTDHLGSTRLVTKQDQSDAACFDFAPFGEEIPDTLGSRSSNACFAASFDGRHRFTGKERDPESDLDYFLARYYSGPMGRFLSVDPENAGADPAFPQTWNAYAYVNNNPLKLVDPDGRVVFTAAALAYLAFEVASTAIDVVNAVQTVRDPNASTTEKAVAVAGAVAGLAVPGPTGKLATTAGKALRAQRAAQLETNRRVGRAFEKTVTATLKGKQSDVVEQLTIRTESGRRIRVDNAGRVGDKTKITEAKSSPTAKPSTNQVGGFRELEEGGGVVVGKGKPGFPKGTVIEPTKVKIVRPKDLEDL